MFSGGGAGGMGCCPNAVNPPTTKSKSLVNTLRIIMYIELGLAILEIAIVGFSYALMELISCLILYQGYTSLSFCHMIMYIFFVGINEIQFIVGFLTYAQNEQPIPWNAPDIVLLFLTAFYLIAIYYAFQAYKEFKGILFDGTDLNAGISGGQNYGANAQQGGNNVYGGGSSQSNGIYIINY